MISLQYPLIMLVALALYSLFGPLVWIGMFAAYGVANARMNRLRQACPLPAVPPHVSILIPAKDEGKGIEECIRSAAAQDYPSFDVLAIDDRSVDATGKILDRLRGSHPNLNVLHIEQGALPSGWLGKCHALAKGVEEIERGDRSAEWIFFVDSDVTLRPDALRIALSNGIERKYDALSVLTRLRCDSFLEKLVLPLAGAAWSVMFTVAQTNDDQVKSNAAANGQFFLIRRAAYDAVGGHAAVRDQITEDVELMRRLKEHDYRVRLCFGDHLATTRMHATLNQMIYGWGRIFSGTARRRPGRILAGIAFILLAGFSVWPAIVYGVGYSKNWLIAAIVHWVAMTAYAALVYARTGQPKRNAIWFPFGQAVLLMLFGYALRMCRTGRVIWRDTHYADWSPAGPSALARGGTIADRSIPIPEAIATGGDRRSGAPTPPE